MTILIWIYDLIMVYDSCLTSLSQGPCISLCPVGRQRRCVLCQDARNTRDCCIASCFPWKFQMVRLWTRDDALVGCKCYISGRWHQKHDFSSNSLVSHYIHELQSYDADSIWFWRSTSLLVLIYSICRLWGAIQLCIDISVQNFLPMDSMDLQSWWSSLMCTHLPHCATLSITLVGNQVLFCRPKLALIHWFIARKNKFTTI